MATLITYQSKHGTTEKCVKLLSEKLAEKPVIRPLNKMKEELSQFDTVIIGGSVHAGNIQRSLKKFLRHYENDLMNVRLGLFLCSAETEEKGEEQFEKNIPESLRNHAVVCGLFGGEFLLDRMNFMERGIIKKIANIEESKSMIQTEEIETFAKKINKID